MLRINQVSGMLCWHRLRLARGRQLCRHCGVAIELCPCVQLWRMVDSNCLYCLGSGWVAQIRGHLARFAEYCAREAAC